MVELLLYFRSSCIVQLDLSLTLLQVYTTTPTKPTHTHPHPHTNFLTCSRHSRRLKFSIQHYDNTNKQFLERKNNHPPPPKKRGGGQNKFGQKKKKKLQIVKWRQKWSKMVYAFLGPPTPTKKSHKSLIQRQFPPTIFGDKSLKQRQCPPKDIS